MAADSEGKLVRLSHVHESIMNWMLLNPDRPLRECADHFELTQSWLSSVIHSDLFQAALKQKQERVFLRLAESIPEKLQRAADIGIEKLTDALEKTEDPDFILDATDKLLHRMGYAPQSSRNPGGAPTNQQNNFFIQASDLLDAQKQMGVSSQLPPPIEGEIS
jgi:hypothetical protein